MTTTPPLRDAKILVTGPAGQIAFPMAKALARDNEVWGIARFSNPAQRQEVEAAGIQTRAIDLTEPDFSDVPRDFTHLLHLAATISGDDYDGAIATNAEGTGLLMSHCRNVQAALIMSSVSIYRPHPDPSHAYRENDPLGDAMLPGLAAYSVAKIAQEAVARYCAREFGIPTTIARMGASYGPRGGLPTYVARMVADGKPWTTRSDPCPYNLIHDDDIFDQVAPLLAAARVPATIVNWAGDEMVNVQEIAAYAGELLGLPAQMNVVAAPGAQPGSGVDNAKRLSITGPCRVGWREGMHRTLQELYPDRVRAAEGAGV